tara:strand:- start:482 stop:1363 length:882 start_codon:yes stop_codon:yes gene_type:complete
MKKIIIVTGGAGFVGSSLINYLLKNTDFKILSIDNYSTGSKKNHFKSINIQYLKADTRNISKKLSKIKKNIHSIFHFGEFSRIFQSFKKFHECFEANSIGSKEVFKFCLDNNIKLIYSATSASLGNNGKDGSLSPYAFTKAKNLELLENLKKWFKFKYEVVYFYNVYGPKQISKGYMATVIGIFQECFQKKKPLPVVRPGTQSRRFTHIDDTIKVCIEAWKNNKCRHYSISSKKSYKILDVAKMFKSKIIFLPKRKGERHSSSLTNMNLNNKVYKRFGKTDLKDYIKTFVSNY